MANRIQLRRDTAQNWANNNPVLFEGEIGIETDTRKIKIGNGTSAWGDNGFNYANVTPEELLAANPSGLGISIDQGGYLVAANNTGIRLVSDQFMLGSDNNLQSGHNAVLNIDEVGNLAVNTMSSILLHPAAMVGFMNGGFYPSIQVHPSEQSITFRSGNTQNQVGSISFDDNSTTVYANNNLDVVAAGGNVHIQSYNADIVLSPDGWAYLYNNADANNRIPTMSNLNSKADLDQFGQVPASQLGNASGGTSVSIHPFAMMG